MTKGVKRLYNQFKPAHYELEIRPDKENMTFSGIVTLKGAKIGVPSQRLTFHQNGLTINSAKITKSHKNEHQNIKVIRINNQNSFDEVRLHTDQKLFPGEYTVTLKFKGKITKAMNGMYPCFFKTSSPKHDPAQVTQADGAQGASQEAQGAVHKGAASQHRSSAAPQSAASISRVTSSASEQDGAMRESVLVATQFESHHAREVFPCIDEPEAKATFDLTLVTPKNEAVVANTPIKTQTKQNDRLVSVFETTPVMSTYLLAFVFGEMDFLEAKTERGVRVRTYATPDNVKFTEFALDVAVKCLDFFNDYFGIDYPLTKCDLLALPDFASGAMENWGCITFREQTLLVDPDNSALSNKQYIAMVVAHELAHQWFGNLVTMRWWTDLWLNEGFASWIEYLAVDHIFPDWQIWTQFIVDEQQQALKLDALEHTHPIEVPVNHPDEIRSIFDAISYSKGASVIHMLHAYLGPETFQMGLRNYLSKHAYNNTDTVDLWASLEEASDKPVKKFMQAWTGQSGFPVLSAKVEEKQVQLKQKRFFINPKHSPQPEVLWPVPLLNTQNLNQNQLNVEQASLNLNQANNFKLNQGLSGFYRTAYNATHVNRLGQLIKKGRLEPLDRIGVLSDLFETAKAGHSNTADALNFLTNFSTETNYAVWDVIASSLGSIRLVMGDDDLRTLMKPPIRQLISQELKRLGWTKQTDEPHFDRLLRPIILGLAASADEPSVIKKCRQLFDTVQHAEQVKPHLKEVPDSQNIKRGIDIDPDMRGVVFGTIARLGDEKDFNKLVRLHNESHLSEERTTLTAAITGFRSPKLIKRALDMINSEDVRLQDVTYWLIYSFMNRHARKLTWQWLKANWQWLDDNLGTDLSFYRMPIYVARVQSDIKFKKDYEAFFKPKLSPALERSYYQGLEMIEWQSDWKKRDYQEVLNFFKRFK